jgi:inhibitor of KinA sporulation pathway (predicted exonuclease)
MKVIIDLEATCDDSEDKTSLFNRDQSEIIEIGACLIDSVYKVVEQFQTFIKPVIQPVLTAFCTQLTSISQRDVENAPGFAVAQDLLDQWFRECEIKYGQIEAWCSWGGYDYRQFLRSNRQMGCEPGYFLTKPHINLKDLYVVMHRPVFKKKRSAGVGLALKQQRMTFVGTAHRALDDAINIAQLAPIAFGDKPSILLTTE